MSRVNEKFSPVCLPTNIYGHKVLQGKKGVVQLLSKAHATNHETLQERHAQNVEVFGRGRGVIIARPFYSLVVADNILRRFSRLPFLDPDASTMIVRCTR